MEISALCPDDVLVKLMPDDIVTPEYGVPVSEFSVKEKVMNAIRNKEVSLLIIKETHDYNSGKNYYDLADDYDYVYSLINDIPGLDLSMLDEQLAKSQQFAYGFYINDIGREYQVGEQRGTNDSQQTA